MNKIKGFRCGLNLTQREMASKLGMNFATYAKKETGKNPITVDEVKLIRSVFNLSLDRIVDMFDL